MEYLTSITSFLQEYVNSDLTINTGKIPPSYPLHYFPFALRDAALWSVGFISIFVVIKVWLATTNYPWYAKQSKKRQFELPPVFGCTIHHIIFVAVASYRMYNHPNIGLTTSLISSQYGGSLAGVPESSRVLLNVDISPMCFGYLVADTVFLPPGQPGSAAYYLHHSLAMMLCVSSMFCPGEFAQLVPFVAIIELSTIFFNFARITRDVTGNRSSTLVKVMEGTFALTFFLTRIVSLPWFVFGALQDGYASYVDGSLTPIVSVLCAIMVILQAMQFVWFSKLVSNMMSGARHKKVEGNSKKDK